MNPSNLSLKEALYLISVKEKDGRANAENLEFGLVGACLFELAEQERITIREKRIIINNTKPTGDSALDIVLQQFQKSQKDRKIKSWVSSLHNRGGKIKRAVRDELYRKRFLIRQQKKFLFVPFKLHPVSKTKERDALLIHLRKILLSKKTFEDQEANLIAMAYASGAFHNVFPDRKDRREAKKKVKALIKEGAISSSVNESIQEMQAAIAAAIATSVAVTVATSSN